jgi:hypothetical protein
MWPLAISGPESVEVRELAEWSSEDTKLRLAAGENRAFLFHPIA